MIWGHPDVRPRHERDHLQGAVADCTNAVWLIGGAVDEENGIMFKSPGINLQKSLRRFRRVIRRRTS